MFSRTTTTLLRRSEPLCRDGTRHCSGEAPGSPSSSRICSPFSCGIADPGGPNSSAPDTADAEAANSNDQRSDPRSTDAQPVPIKNAPASPVARWRGIPGLSAAIRTAVVRVGDAPASETGHRGRAVIGPQRGAALVNSRSGRVLG
jgi:hypothetical protein